MLSQQKNKIYFGLCLIQHFFCLLLPFWFTKNTLLLLLLTFCASPMFFVSKSICVLTSWTFMHVLINVNSGLYI